MRSILYFFLFFPSAISVAQTFEVKVSEKLCDCFSTIDQSQEGRAVLAKYQEDCFVQTLKLFDAEINIMMDTISAGTTFGDTDYEKGHKFGLEMFNRIQLTMIEKCDPFFNFMDNFRNGVFRTANEEKELLNIKNKSKDITEKQNPADYYSRAVSYFALRKFKRAKRDLDKAIELDRNSPAPYLLRGFLYEQTKRYENAIVDYEVSNKLMVRGDIDIYIAMARRKAREGR